MKNDTILRRINGAHYVRYDPETRVVVAGYKHHVTTFDTDGNAIDSIYLGSKSPDEIRKFADELIVSERQEAAANAEVSAS